MSGKRIIPISDLSLYKKSHEMQQDKIDLNDDIEPQNSNSLTPPSLEGNLKKEMNTEYGKNGVSVNKPTFKFEIYNSDINSEHKNNKINSIIEPSILPVGIQKYQVESQLIGNNTYKQPYAYFDTSKLTLDSSVVATGTSFEHYYTNNPHKYLESKCANCGYKIIHYKLYEHYFCDHCKMIVEVYDSVPSSKNNNSDIDEMFAQLYKDVVAKDKRITELENEIKTIKNLLDNMNISI
jgi:predicted nucleic-acid-binding Zn-ribbon protein